MPKDWDFYAVVPKLTERTVEWIGEQRKKRARSFFMCRSTRLTRRSCRCEKFRGQSQAGGYGDWVAQTDDNVGRILQALEDNGCGRNTLVIFFVRQWAGSSRLQPHPQFRSSQSGPLRGVKRDLWEGGIACLDRPLAGARKTGDGQRRLVSQVDVMATLAAVVGATLPAGSAPDSYNLLPCGRKAQPSPRDVDRPQTGRQLRGAARDEWLLVAAKSGGVVQVPDWSKENGYTKNDYPGELYDLSQDLGERHNLYGERPDKVAELEVAADENSRGAGQVR